MYICPWEMAHGLQAVMALRGIGVVSGLLDAGQSTMSCYNINGNEKNYLDIFARLPERSLSKFSAFDGQYLSILKL
jgi:hypothetical protein